MTATAWPFLMGRTVNAGHRVVVSPGFLTEAGGILAGIAIHPELPERRACLHALRLPAGRATAVYRTFVATGVHFGLDPAGPLRDRAGRQILLTEGIVLPVGRRRTLRLGLTETDLATAHDILVPLYQRFWREEDRFPSGVASTPFSLGQRSGTPLFLHDHRRPTAGPATRSLARLWHPASLGAAGAAIVLGTVGAWAITDPPDVPPTPTETATLTTAPPSTTRPVPNREPRSKHRNCLLVNNPSQRLPYC